MGSSTAEDARRIDATFRLTGVFRRVSPGTSVPSGAQTTYRVEGSDETTDHPAFLQPMNGSARLSSNMLQLIEDSGAWPQPLTQGAVAFIPKDPWTRVLVRTSLGV